MMFKQFKDTGNEKTITMEIYETDKVIFFHHSAGKNPGFNLFAFSIRNSETDGWIFVLIAHSFAPFVWMWQQV